MGFLDIQVRSNADDVTAAWFNDIRTAARSSGAWSKYTVTHDQLQAAATSNDIELFSLTARQVIHKVFIKQTVPFAGTSITAYTVSVGIAALKDKYAPPFDVFQAVADAAHDLNEAPGFESIASPISIRVQGISTGANLDQSTAGSVEIQVYKSELPL